MNNYPRVTQITANYRSFQTFVASTQQESGILKCVQDHIVPFVKKEISDLLVGRVSSESPFRVLSVGSGEGENDINPRKLSARFVWKKEKQSQ